MPVSLRDPLPDVPARAPGCGRPPMPVEVGPRGEWSSPLAMEGAARDLRTGLHSAEGGAESGSEHRSEHSAEHSAERDFLLAEVHVSAGFDVSRRLESLATSPAAPWTEALIGARAGGGFRRHLEEVVPPSEASSLLRQVLDDM